MSLTGRPYYVHRLVMCPLALLVTDVINNIAISHQPNAKMFFNDIN